MHVPAADAAAVGDRLDQPAPAEVAQDPEQVVLADPGVDRVDQLVVVPADGLVGEAELAPRVGPDRGRLLRAEERPLAVLAKMETRPGSSGSGRRTSPRRQPRPADYRSL
jgi:hypothetical protein